MCIHHMQYIFTNWTHLCNQHPNQEIEHPSIREAFITLSSSHHSLSESLSWLWTRSLLLIFVFYMNGIILYAFFVVGSLLFNTMFVKFIHIVHFHCCMVFSFCLPVLHWWACGSTFHICAMTNSAAANILEYACWWLYSYIYVAHILRHGIAGP